MYYEWCVEVDGESLCAISELIYVRHAQLDDLSLRGDRAKRSDSLGLISCGLVPPPPHLPAELLGQPVPWLGLEPAMSYQAWLLDHDEGAWVPEVDRLEYFGDPTSFDDGVDYFHISVSAMSGELSDTEPFLTERLSDLDSAMLRDHTDDREAEGEFALDPHPYDIAHRESTGIAE